MKTEMELLLTFQSNSLKNTNILIPLVNELVEMKFDINFAD